ncbi:MAG: HPF/RaiA family ribosome-associated protein, partial [Alphaproteobacteria bacterium]
MTLQNTCVKLFWTWLPPALNVSGIPQIGWPGRAAAGPWPGFAASQDFEPRCNLFRIADPASVDIVEGEHELRVDIAGRHLAVTEAMEVHIREKLQRLAKVFDGGQSARVTLVREAGRNKAEIVIVALRNQLVSKAEDANDMYAAIDA